MDESSSPQPRSRFEAIRELYERRFAQIFIVIEGTVIALWLISALVPAWRQVLYNAILVIIAFFVLDTLRYVLELRRDREAPPVQIFSRGMDAQKHVEYLLKQTAQAPKAASLVVYAANTHRDLLLQLRDMHCAMRILIHHVDTAENDTQKERIRASINDLRDAVFKGYSDVELYAYRRPAAMRGMVIGDRVVAVGWYSYAGPPLGLQGEGNAVVVADPTTTPGKTLADMFARIFDDLVSDSSTERLPLTA